MKLNILKTSIGVALASVVGTAQAQYTEELPTSFDLRDVNGHNYLSPVQNQGSFGSCYAFGATAAAESAYNMAMGLYDENATNFSESYIIWYLGQYYDGFGGEGANGDYDELQALVDYGIISDADFPYVTTDPGEGNYHTDAETVTFSSWHRIAAFDVQTMKYVIQNVGALDVGIYATNGFAYYGYSSMDEPYSEYMSSNGVIDNQSSMNHAVAVVGWNDSIGVNGAWILRNSWGTGWGDEGYINIAYNSSRISMAAAYLIYGDWTGEDFTIVNDEKISVNQANSIGSYTVNGIYEWGGNNASITNNADIEILQAADSGDAVSKGITLWAGNSATLTNNGNVYVECVAYNGIGTAYGLMSQGHSMVNTGDVSTWAHGYYQANSYAARFLSYDNTGVFENSGSLYAYATYGKAYGAYIDNAATVTNSGEIEAEGYYYSVGLAVNNVGEVTNDGTITSSSALGYSIAAYIDTCDSFINNQEITAQATNGTAYAVFAQDSNVVNNGTISATSDNSASVGLLMQDSTLINSGTITADYNDFEDSVITNNGTITGNELNYFTGCTLQGSGMYVGNVEAQDTIVSPGNSIGTLSFDGNVEFTDGLVANIEVGNGSIDKVIATGYIYVAGAAEINITPVGYLAAGDYNFVQADNGLYSDGSGYTLNFDYLMFENSELSYDADTVTLNVTRHSYNDFVSSTNISNMAKTLDKVRKSADGYLASILNSIDVMETSSEIGDAVTEFFPAINYTTGYAAMQNLHRTDEYIVKHNKYMTLAGDYKYNSWFNFVSNDEDVDAFGEIPGYSNKMRGYVGGVDRKINDQYSAGIAVATTTQTVDSNERADYSKIKGDQIYAYASWDQTPDFKGFYAVGALGYGRLHFNTDRQMALVDGTVHSFHKAKAYTAAISTGYDYSNEHFIARPYASLKYAKLDENAYTEDSNRGVNLSFDRVESDSLEGSLGFSFGGKFSIKAITFMPEVHVEYARELDGSVDSVYAEFETGHGFTTPVRELSDKTLTYGCSLSAKITENSMFNIAYDFIDYDSYNDEATKVSTTFQLRF